jgi:hypothetical protein
MASGLKAAELTMSSCPRKTRRQSACDGSRELRGLRAAKNARWPPAFKCYPNDKKA